MWGGISQLDLPYEVRHMMRFKDKYQRPLTDREKEIIEKVKVRCHIRCYSAFIKCFIMIRYLFAIIELIDKV
jgi:uncharacterized protein YeeX (DUF496 family)